jgi:hypothetical protein
MVAWLAMSNVANFDDFSSALTILLEAILLFYLLRRRLQRSYPAFLTYILTAIIQGLLWEFASHYWGPRSKPAFVLYWGVQAVVVATRWLAVIEIARKVLADYSGIQRMVTRVLFVLGVCVLVYSFAVSDFSWTLMVLNADRAIELCIATLVVCMFLFARYYRLPMLNMERQLAIGFCLYSCSRVVNDSILEHWQGAHWDFLNYVNVLAFLASLVLWIGAVRGAVEVRRTASGIQLSPEMYGQLSEQLNSRLQLLNQRLNHLSRSGDSRP